MQMSERDEGLAWQAGIWDRMSEVYRQEIDPRLAPVVDHLIGLADLEEGEQVLDLGTGTGAVAEKGALAVGPRGRVLGVDPSSVRFEVAEGSGESIPAAEASFDIILIRRTMSSGPTRSSV